jgi:Cu/Ag efflux protein CusF
MMKKIMTVLIAVLVVLSFSMVVVAQSQEELKVVGKVMKIDATTKSITIRSKQDGAMVAIVMEDAALLSKVEEGNKAEAKYIVKDGVNIGVKLRKMTGGCS